MANCHFDQIKRPVPVAVLTDLDNKIIINNSPNDENTNNYYKRSTSWVVSGLRVMITRFWASSTATIMVVPHMPSNQNYCPPFPKELTIEKEFCIWMGYIDTIRLVSEEDLKQGYLVRTFVGVVDNLKSTGSAIGGYSIMIQARDRMKYFMDSEVYYSNIEITRIFKPEFGETSNGIPRSNLIHDICCKSINSPRIRTTDDETKLTTASDEYIAKKWIVLDVENSQDIELDNEIEPFKYYVGQDSFLGGGSFASATNSPKVDSNLLLRVITTRVGIGGKVDADGEGLTFLLNGQLPVDVIKSIAMQEVYPTEFFQDNRNGNIYYCPRANDSTGLYDDRRFYRTYFFNIPDKSKAIASRVIGVEITTTNESGTPDGTTINEANQEPLPSNPSINAKASTDNFNVYVNEDNQNLIAYREEMSSIGMKTNFLVSISSPLTSATPHKDYVIHLATNPYALREVDFVPKFQRIIDPTVKTPQEAAIVAMSAARIWGKETNVGMTVMIGDPSFVPGEIIQVIGSPLLGAGDNELGGGLDRLNSDRQKYNDYESNAKQMILDYATYSSSASRVNIDPNRTTDGRNTPKEDKSIDDTTYVQKRTDNSILAKAYDKSGVLFKIGQPDPNLDGSSKQLSDATKDLVGTAEALTKKSGTSFQYGAEVDLDNATPDTEPKGFEELPRTIYRVEAIQHKLNLGNPGFTSELALISAFTILIFFGVINIINYTVIA